MHDCGGGMCEAFAFPLRACLMWQRHESVGQIRDTYDLGKRTAFVIVATLSRQSVSHGTLSHS